MKILVLQLTRPGDIFCSAPALSALKRTRPEAEIHFLVRKKFASATALIRSYDHLWTFDTQSLLAEFVTGSGEVNKVVAALHAFISEIRREKFDKIVNLSFSPSSSYLAHLISEAGKVPVIGYSRTSDFYLSVPDTLSQYFRAQVGLDKSNRIHVMDILSKIAGAQNKTSDMHPFAHDDYSKSGIVLHLGASRKEKTWTETSWISFLSKLREATNERFFFVGSAEERSWVEKIVSQAGLRADGIENLAGQETWVDLKNRLSTARLFIGADSGPLHVANLAGCQTLNLSLGDVRFWETGPTVLGSRIIRRKNPSHLDSDTVLMAAIDILNGGKNYEGSAVCVSLEGVRYQVYGDADVEPDAWPLVRWMYFGGPKPQMKGDLVAALKQIQEISFMAMDQIRALEKHPQKTSIVGILDRLDELADILRRDIQPLRPLLDDFKAAKENIPPGHRADVFYNTFQVYKILAARAETLLATGSREERISP